MNTNVLGAFLEIRAQAWLLEQGYEVFNNVRQHGPIDLVAVKNGETLFIDVKGVMRTKRRGVKFYLPNAAKQTVLQDELGVVRLHAFKEDDHCFFSFSRGEMYRYLQKHGYNNNS